MRRTTNDEGRTPDEEKRRGGEEETTHHSPLTTHSESQRPDDPTTQSPDEDEGFPEGECLPTGFDFAERYIHPVDGALASRFLAVVEEIRRERTQEVAR